MRKHSIPVNTMANEFGTGISIEKVVIKELRNNTIANTSHDESKQSHRHDGHSFFLLEKGTVNIEIDFKKYTIRPSTIIYIHPNQVHRTTVSNDAIVNAWSLTDENLHPAYLKLLEDIVPAKPLKLKEKQVVLIAEAIALCLKFFGRTNDKLYHSLLKDSCNALVALVISQYLEQVKPIEKLSRFENIYKRFREILEQNFIELKRPADYAAQLHISTAYLNECVKNTTGQPVSYHIQQRIILEAKRLLVHGDQSVKEISAVLGYDDYPYFSRLFTKTTGTSALAFRAKNRD